MPTSTFAVAKQVADDMDAAAFPPHPVTGELPRVSIGAPSTEAAEQIVIRIRTSEDAATTEWASMRDRDERYIVDVWVLSEVRGVEWPEMWERLADLTGVVLATYTDPATGGFTPPGGLDAEGANQFGVWTGDITAEEHDQWGTDEGWAGQCRVALRFAAQIRPTLT